MTPLSLGVIDPTAALVSACVIAGSLAVIGISFILGFARKFRAELADELKRELKNQDEAKRIDVQQPLVVQPHTEFATKQALEEVKRQAHGRMDRERSELTDRVDKLESKIDQNTSMTAEMRGEVKQINQNVALLQNSMTQFIRDSARTA